MNATVEEKLASALAARTAISFTQEMVRIDSTNGKEDALARQLEAMIASLGVGKVWCEKTYEGRLNTLWEVDSGRPGPRLLFTGHLDTKPVCEGWERDPFDGAIENGRVHGHGVMDMKAGLGSLIGGIPETQEMLDFCAEHGLAADIERIEAGQINDAWERVLSSDVRYRFVIDNSTLA